MFFLAVGHSKDREHVCVSVSNINTSHQLHNKFNMFEVF